MTTPERRKEGASTFVNQVQTVIQVIGATILLWVGSSLIDVRDRIIRLEVLYQTGAASASAEIMRIKERVDVLERKAAASTR